MRSFQAVQRITPHCQDKYDGTMHRQYDAHIYRGSAEPIGSSLQHITATLGRPYSYNLGSLNVIPKATVQQDCIALSTAWCISLL